MLENIIFISSEILHEAEYMWEREQQHSQLHSDTTSESGLSTSSSSACSSGSGASAPSTCRASAVSEASRRHQQQVEVSTPRGRRILGNPSGPTIITVSGHLGSAAAASSQSPSAAAALAAAQRYESMLYHSMEEPVDSVSAAAAAAGNGNSVVLPASAAALPAGVHNANGAAASAASGLVLNSHVLFDEAVDLEPIDFEHFVDEPEMSRNQSERMFQVLDDR